MAIVQNFSSSQVLGQSSQLTLTDTSTGTDVLVTGRRVYLQKKDGTYLTETGTTTDYEVWADFPATTTITLDLLDKDYALNVRVDWVNVSGVTLYTKTTLTLFPLWAKTYFIFLVKAQSSNKKLIDLANFYFNEIRLLCSIKEAIDAVELASDIDSAQSAIDRAKTLIDNPSNFF